MLQFRPLNFDKLLRLKPYSNKKDGENPIRGKKMSIKNFLILNEKIKL